jgi:hypothetical protein
MKVSVACCSCMRIMDPDGKPLGKKIGHNRAMNIDEIVDHFSHLKPEAACFPDRQKADRTAISFGWSVIDGDHRCPDCDRARETRPYVVERQGCYIEWEAA